jgi:hypothetical protein
VLRPRAPSTLATLGRRQVPIRKACMIMTSPSP